MDNQDNKKKQITYFSDNYQANKEWGKTAKKVLKCLCRTDVFGNYTLAAYYAGCSRGYIHQLHKRFPAFLQQCEDIKVEARKSKGEIAENQLMKLVSESNPTAVIFTVKKMLPEEYGDKGEDKPLDPIQHIHTLSPEYMKFLGKDGNTKPTDNK